MIIFTRLNQRTIAINPDLIERVEITPDTVITLVDDKKFLVKESLEEVISLITDYRAYVIARSSDMQMTQHPRPTLHLVTPDSIVSPHALALHAEELGGSDDAAWHPSAPSPDLDIDIDRAKNTSPESD